MQLKLFDGRRYKRLTREARDRLSKPLGRLYKGYELDSLHEKVASLKARGVEIATVGDRVSKTFIEWGVIPDIAAVDCIERRRPTNPPPIHRFNMVVEVENLRGYVNMAIVDLLREVYDNRPILLRVSGEEDLVGIPIIVFMSGGSHVYYGQPGEGVVDVEVGDDVKKLVLGLLGGDEGG